MTVRLSPAALPAATQTESLLPGPPASLAFLTPAQSVRAGVCSGELQLAAVDAFGNPAPSADANVTVGLGGPAAQLFLDAACSLPAGVLELPPDAGAARFHFLAADAGELNLAASASGALAPASQLEDISP